MNKDITGTRSDKLAVLHNVGGDVPYCIQFWTKITDPVSFKNRLPVCTRVITECSAVIELSTYRTTLFQSIRGSWVTQNKTSRAFLPWNMQSNNCGTTQLKSS